MPTVAHHRLLATLAISLLLHVAIMALLDGPGWPLPSTPDGAGPPTGPIELRLRRAVRDADAPQPAPRPRREASAQTPPPATEAQSLPASRPDTSEAPRRSAPVSQLDLSLPESPAHESVSPGRVFDPRLARRIDEQRERSSRYGRRAASRQSDSPGQSSFTGGRWSSFVEMGGRCFRVIEADPLEPLSTEQWFAVNCE